MYCPNCGSSNQADVKFCKHCGTNLAVVTDALAGKTPGKSTTEDRMAKVTRDYYRGRRETITGAVLIPAGLLIMALMMAAGVKPTVAFFIICWLFFWGAGSLASGLGRWIAATSELRTLGIGSQSPIQAMSFQQHPPANQKELPTGPYSKGPAGYPGSVTEQTTRELDERIGIAPERSRQQGE